MSELHTVPARRGKAHFVNKGQSIKIINTHGTQVVDFWAFVAGHLTEYTGMDQCRATWTAAVPQDRRCAVFKPPPAADDAGGGYLARAVTTR